MLISTVYFIPSGQNYTESRRTQIIEGDNEWILQCNITNEAERDIQYTIFVTIDDVVRRDSIVVQPGKTYIYTHHINLQQLDEGKVTFALYQGDKAELLEEATYYININKD